MHINQIDRSKLFSRVSGSPEPWWAAVSARLAELPDHPRGRMLAALDGGLVRAILGLELSWAVDGRLRCATIRVLEVDPDFDDRGIGMRLVRFAQGIARINRCNGVHLAPGLEQWESGCCWRAVGCEVDTARTSPRHRTADPTGLRMTAGPRIKPDEEVFLDITIDRGSDEPIYRQLVRGIQAMIHTRGVARGLRLPPERRLAAALDVNRSTVLNAYRELKALGLVDAHVGRGTAVLRPPAAPARPGAATDVPWRQLFRGGAARSRDPILADLLAMTERRDMISFSIGLPAPELLPVDHRGRLTDEILRNAGPPSLLHCPTEGHTPLRDTLARWLASRGIHARTSEVLVVSGSQQGLDLLARTFSIPATWWWSRSPPTSALCRPSAARRRG